MAETFLRTAADGTGDGKAGLTWRDRYRLWRNRLIGSPGFRSAGRHIPGFSAIASSRANDLFAITTGFAQSQVLLVFVETGLPAFLAERPRTVAAVARHAGLGEDNALRLLRAAAGLELAAPLGGGLWTLADHGAVIAASPGLVAMIRHHGLVYRDLADPLALLREPPAETETSRFWAYVGSPDGKIDPQAARTYSELMRVSQDMVIEEVLATVPMARFRSVLDVGGGDGAFIEAVGKRWPHLDLALFDLPAVAERASERLRESPVAPRLSIHGGSFFDHAIPAHADTYSLIRVLYDHGDEAALAILRAVRSAMDPGDMLVIGEPMDGTSRGAGLAAAYFTMYLAAMRSGRCRSPQDHFALLRAAGFTRMKVLPTALPVISGVIVANP